MIFSPRLSSDNAPRIGSLFGFSLIIQCFFGVTADAVVGIHKIETPGETIAGQALSGDGQVVVGTKSGGTSAPFRWTVAGGYEAIVAPTYSNHQSVRRANHDGSAFIGDYGAGGTGYRWNGGYTNIVGAPDKVAAGPHGISDDGTIVVGDANTTGTGFYTFRWVSGSYTVFDVPEPFTTYSSFNDVSGDGLYACAIGGVPSYPGDRKVFRHHFGTGARDVLGSSNFRWTAVAMSNDGNVIIGRTRNTDISPYHWEIDTNTVVYMGSLDPSLPAHPADLSEDGSLVVGRSQTPSGDKAFVWDDSVGMRSLEGYIVEKGGALNGWTFSQAHQISDDGDAILATGSNSNPPAFFNGSVLITGLNQPPVPVPDISLSGDGLNYEISFQSEVGQDYWLQGSADLGATPWSDETSPVPGTGALMTLSVPLVNYPQTSFFFRVATEFTP